MALEKPEVMTGKISKCKICLGYNSMLFLVFGLCRVVAIPYFSTDSALCEEGPFVKGCGKGDCHHPLKLMNKLALSQRYYFLEYLVFLSF